MEKNLNDLVAKLKAAAGENLKSVVLYGSAASGEFQAQHSDLNILCGVGRLNAPELAKLSPAAVWWARKGHPAPLVFTIETLLHSADVFAIELLDIKASRRVLFGEDPFDTLDVPMSLHRLQVERELRINLIRLRQHYLTARPNPKAVLRLMTESVSTFAALFRHALIALGEQASRDRREAVTRLAAILGFNSEAFDTLLDIREGKRRHKDVDLNATFQGYLKGITQVTEEVDRRFADAG